MADRPEVGGVPNYFPWATQTTIEAVNVNGEELLLSNKEPPLTEHTNNGLKYDEPPNYLELNYQLQGYSQWCEHLDGRLFGGSVHATTTSETAAEISDRLGGTWNAIGSETLGSETIYYFTKIG